MIKEVSVELFKFDHKTDYLPYYKRYIIEYEENDKIIDLLNQINEMEKFNFNNAQLCKLNINNFFMTSDELIADVVKRTNDHLIIKPLSVFRAQNDLIVDKSDFLHKIDKFKKYLSDDEIKEYAEKYKLEYYASNSLNFNKDYIGDHALLIASDLIEKKPEIKDKVLEFIADKDDGIWYHTSLKNRMFNFDAQKEKKIRNLFTMFKESEDFVAEEEALQEIPMPEISQHFENFNIASYNGSVNCSFESIIKNSKANYININSKNEDLAPYSYVADNTFSYKIAGQILLEAKDNNADFLIVRHQKDLDFFDKEQKKIEKFANREIDLPIISREQFIKLLQGEKDNSKLGFDSHKVEVSFL